MTTSSIAPFEAPEIAIRRRSARLAALTFARFRNLYRLTSVGFILGTFIAGLLANYGRSPVLGVAAGVAITGACALLAWRPLLDPDLRGAVELINDHNCHEGAEWRNETGTKVPIGVAAMERWLASHPTGPGRASVLLRLGRLEAADRAIAEMNPTTPEEAFGVEILRETRTFLAGRRPDLSRLQASWGSLPDPRERRHRRECLALLEAEVAAADRLDPILPLAVARREIGEVHGSMQMGRVLARWLVFGLVLVVIGAALGAALG